jgi:hypothetical protein
MIRADIYFAFDYLHQKKIVDRLRFSALHRGNLSPNSNEGNLSVDTKWLIARGMKSDTRCCDGQRAQRNTGAESSKTKHVDGDANNEKVHSRGMSVRLAFLCRVLFNN